MMHVDYKQIHNLNSNDMQTEYVQACLSLLRIMCILELGSVRVFQIVLFERPWFRKVLKRTFLRV